MIRPSRRRARSTMFVIVLVIAGMAGGCRNAGDSVSSPKRSASFEQPFTAEPPAPAPVPMTDQDEGSLTYATTSVPDGWGIVGVTETTTVVTLPSGDRIDRIRTIFYGREHGGTIGFTITSMAQFSSDGGVIGELIDGRFVECPSAGYATQWDCEGVAVTVEAFDGSVDQTTIQSNLYEISADAFEALMVEVGRPRKIVGSESGSIDGREWMADATVPIDVPTSRGPGSDGCMELRRDGEQRRPGESIEPVCVSRIGQMSSATVVQIDGAMFIIGVITSTSESFVVRNLDPDRPGTIEPTVLISDLDPTLRWIVAPLDEQMTECLTIESGDGSMIDTGDMFRGPSIRVSIPHSIPYGYCDPVPASATRLGPPVRWDAARTGMIGDLRADGIVVTFLGAREKRDSSDRCGANYVAVAHETGTEIVVTVHPVESDAPADPVACQAVGAKRIAEVQLDVPVGNRNVRDGSSGEIRDPVDGPTIVDPSWMPDGFSLTLEDGTGRSSANEAWERIWTRSATDRWLQVVVCQPTTQHIAITQIPGGSLPEVMAWERMLPERTIAGRTVRVLAETSDENVFLRLDLVDGGRYLRLDGFSDCMGAPGPSLDDLVKVLESAI